MWRVAIDVGGTFTDFVAESDDGEWLARKVLTTPQDPLAGVLSALTGLRGDVGYLVHATTLAINTVIERTGAKVVMLTTKGFRDVIETGREDRYNIYDLAFSRPESLVPRHRRLPVSERIEASGVVRQVLEKEAVVQILAQEEGLDDIESFAVCFLHSYKNDAHELAAADVVRQTRGNVHVSVSSDVMPIIREYERFIGTVVNAYIAPRVGGYISRMRSGLNARGVVADLGIMKSDGGTCTPEEAARHPVRILESGPIAGVIASAEIARRTGEELAVAFDMGGTTAKACLLASGRAVVTEELEIARLRRFTPGSGIPIRLPSVDLAEVGAGGGSIAWIDTLGLLQVGPASAGADPGPACYGRGGTRPTVTDADLILGYLDPEKFAEGRIKLDRDAAEQAIARELINVVGESFSIVEAAWGISDIVNENMTRSMRAHCLEHAVDPTDVVIIATGGAGPVHAPGVMAKLGARRVICPPAAGVASAVGLVVAPRTSERVITDICFLDDLAAAGDGLSRKFEDLIHHLAPVGAHDGDREHTLELFTTMRVAGQVYEVRVEMKREWSPTELEAAFRRQYAARFGHHPPNGRLQIVNWGVRSIVEGSHDAIESWFTSSFGAIDVRTAGVQARRAYWGPDAGWQDGHVVSPDQLKDGGWISGPAFFDAPFTTLVVGPGQRVAAGPAGCLVVE